MASPKAVTLVQQLKEKAETHPFWAWAIIIFTVGAILVAGVNQSIQLWKAAFGDDRPPAPTVIINITKDGQTVEQKKVP